MTASKTYTWDRANQYCANLGSGWQGISIGTHQEDSLVREAIIEDRLPWIWTSGHIKNHGFAWASGEEFVDNREGNEHCLGVLNNVYDDGVKWHDIACNHDKAIICERKVRVHG
ncbi:E-selectin-like [Penaeus chinensis]|uniref:E-selectin-like n=1 Tax=Penaeus chinensis TaxID=139456 RepID=UPI001FB765A3|nr:E-selectin-like [Penaeus chinensis]